VVNVDSGRERIVFFILAGIGLILGIFMQYVPTPLLPLGVVMGIAALIFAVLAFGIKDYSYLIDPIMHMKGRSLVLDSNEPFYLASNGKALVIRSGNIVYATSFIKIPLYTNHRQR
jgi:hypothetical protein